MSQLRSKSRRALSFALIPPAIIVMLYLALLLFGGGLAEKPPLEFGGDKKRVILLAHRGATDGVPENTRQSLLKARQRGYPGVEVDIQMSTDSVFFIFHDRVAQTYDGESDTLSDLKWEAIQKLRVIPCGSERVASILSLDSAFSEFGESFYWYLDLKRHGYRDSYATADLLVSLIRRHHLQDRAAIASVHAGLIAYIEWNYPEQLTILEGVNPGAAWLLNWAPCDIRPDMLGMFQYVFTEGYAEWLRENNWLDRAVVFHVTETTLAETLGRGARLVMVDDGPYLDSLLLAGNARESAIR